MAFDVINFLVSIQLHSQCLTSSPKAKTKNKAQGGVAPCGGKHSNIQTLNISLKYPLKIWGNASHQTLEKANPKRPTQPPAPRIEEDHIINYKRPKTIDLRMRPNGMRQL